MTSSQLSVTKSNGALIVPSEPTPNHTLPLSRFDKNLMSSNFAKMFVVYKQGPQQAAEIIKDALAKALVPYYPLAGRIVKSEKGEIPGVACTGDGVWFVDASADCSLEDVMGLLELPPSEFPEEQLFPYPPNPVGMTIMLQVTQFVCGGFVVGLKYDHIIADGAGIAEIMKAIAEIARGLKQPVVAPVWLREQIPNPTISKMAQPSLPRQAMCLEHLIIDIPLDHVNQVKAQFMEQTGERCSTFDITVAQLWQCRVRAIGPDQSINSVLGFPANARRLLSNLPAEGGYYGNCLFPVTVATSGDKIAKASIVEVVTMIKDAKKRLPVEFAKWAKGELHQNATVTTVADYDMMVVTDWCSLGFSNVDYGWGGPSYFAPTPQPRELVSPPVCIVIKSPTPNNACRLITRCVKKEHFEVFSHQMTNFYNNVKNEECMH